MTNTEKVGGNLYDPNILDIISEALLRIANLSDLEDPFTIKVCL